EARAIYPTLREDLGRIAAGWYCAELIDRFTPERAPTAPLFDLLETALRHLDAGFPAALVCRWFDLHLLDRSGFRPELADCVPCRRAGPQPRRRDRHRKADGRVHRGQDRLAREASRLRVPVERDLRWRGRDVGLRPAGGRAQEQREARVVAIDGPTARGHRRP